MRRIRASCIAVLIGASLAAIAPERATAQAAEIQLEPRSLLDGLVEMQLPKEFQPMPQHLRESRYPDARPSVTTLSDETGAVSLLVKHTGDPLPKAHMAEARAAYERRFRKIFPSATWLRSELAKINAREFILYDLRTPTLAGEVHNLILTTSVDERMLVISFDVPKEAEETWLEPVQRMIQSIVIKR